MRPVMPRVPVCVAETSTRRPLEPLGRDAVDEHLLLRVALTDAWVARPGREQAVAPVLPAGPPTSLQRCGADMLISAQKAAVV